MRDGDGGYSVHFNSKIRLFQLYTRLESGMFRPVREGWLHCAPTTAGWASHARSVAPGKNGKLIVRVRFNFSEALQCPYVSENTI